MSKIPDTKKPKYNNHDAFRWVDSQWEKFMTEQKEMKRHITQLQDDLVTCNKYFQKQRNELLKLEMENAELKNQVTENEYRNKWGNESFQGNKK